MRDATAVVGFAALVTGIGCWDWRLALVFGGGLLLAGSIYGMYRTKP